MRSLRAGKSRALVCCASSTLCINQGNLQEKSLVLKMLEQPEECQTALAAVEALRKWTLWRRRAVSVGITEPDPSILLRGLDRITGAVARGSGELAFRVSLIRSTLQVEVCPSSQSIASFSQHLQLAG